MYKGLRAYIYRSAHYDCKINEMFGKDQVTIIDPAKQFPEIPELFAPTEDAPAVVVIKRFIAGRDYYHLEPYQEGVDYGKKNQFGSISKPKWYMSGGTKVDASDSRFPGEYALDLHDRYEGK